MPPSASARPPTHTAQRVPSAVSMVGRARLFGCRRFGMARCRLAALPPPVSMGRPLSCFGGLRLRQCCGGIADRRGGDVGSGDGCRNDDCFGRRRIGCAGRRLEAGGADLLTMRQERFAQAFEIEFEHAQPLLLAPDDDHQRHDRNNHDERDRIPKKHCLPLLCSVVPAHWARFKAASTQRTGLVPYVAPSVCRTSPPQGGKSDLTNAFVNLQRCEEVARQPPPISPLAGEMSADRGGREGMRR